MANSQNNSEHLSHRSMTGGKCITESIASPIGWFHRRMIKRIKDNATKHKGGETHVNVYN